MKAEYKLLLIAFFAILLVDALGSMGSRQFNVNYAYIGVLSFAVYFALGFIATKKKDLKTGILLTATLGLFDATVGWKVSMLLHANVGTLNNNPSTQQ